LSGKLPRLRVYLGRLLPRARSTSIPSPPTTPESSRKRPSPPLYATPTSVGRALQEIAGQVVQEVRIYLGDQFSTDGGVGGLENDYQNFHLEKKRPEPNWNVASLAAQRDHIKRVIHVANLFVLTPPSDPEQFAKDRARILSLIFAHTQTYFTPFEMYLTLVKSRI
jgi:hypothetical protein